AWLEPDHVTGMNLLHCAVPALNQPTAKGHDQCLAQRVGVPGRACTGFEGDMSPLHPVRIGLIEHRVDPNRTGEPVCGPFGGWSGASARDFHDGLLAFNVMYTPVLPRSCSPTLAHYSPRY